MQFLDRHRDEMQEELEQIEEEQVGQAERRGGGGGGAVWA